MSNARAVFYLYVKYRSIKSHISANILFDVFKRFFGKIKVSIKFGELNIFILKRYCYVGTLSLSHLATVYVDINILSFIKD